jgi:cytoskeleton protein RodZ
MSGVMPATAESPGARLAAARERLGMSTALVAGKLRVDPEVVSALETGAFARLGAAVFVRGFLRRYAELVGESPAEIEALYARQPDAATLPDLSQTSLHRLDAAARRRALGVVPAVIAVAVLGLVAAVWWAMRLGTGARSAVTDEQAQVLHVPADTAPATAGTGAAAPQASVPPAAAGGTGAAGTGDNPADALAAALPRKRLEIAFQGECWAEIYDARGQRLFFGFGHEGTRQELSGVPPFRLVLGNAGAVTLAFEGAPVALPAAAPGARLRLSLRSNGTVASAR